MMKQKQEHLIVLHADIVESFVLYEGFLFDVVAVLVLSDLFRIMAEIEHAATISDEDEYEEFVDNNNDGGPPGKRINEYGTLYR